jgi:hypothetical protein
VIHFFSQHSRSDICIELAQKTFDGERRPSITSLFPSRHHRSVGTRVAIQSNLVIKQRTTERQPDEPNSNSTHHPAFLSLLPIRRLTSAISSHHHIYDDNSRRSVCSTQRHNQRLQPFNPFDY